jgi:hypothetical protein
VSGACPRCTLSVILCAIRYRLDDVVLVSRDRKSPALAIAARADSAILITLGKGQESSHKITFSESRHNV